jgi:Flp pilus assembly pilin Flp
MITKITKSIRQFHNDEEGLEALQVVMIIAIAAMVMIACATIGKAAVSWMGDKWKTLKGNDLSKVSGA